MGRRHGGRRGYAEYVRVPSQLALRGTQRAVCAGGARTRVGGYLRLLRERRSVSGSRVEGMGTRGLAITSVERVQTTDPTTWPRRTPPHRVHQTRQADPTQARGVVRQCQRSAPRRRVAGGSRLSLPGSRGQATTGHFDRCTRSSWLVRPVPGSQPVTQPRRHRGIHRLRRRRRRRRRRMRPRVPCLAPNRCPNGARRPRMPCDGPTSRHGARARTTTNTHRLRPRRELLEERRSA